MVTRALAGESAVSRRWRDEPAAAVAAVGAGLRSLHQTLPVESCPFRWSTHDRVQDVHLRAAAGEIDPAGWLDEHRMLSLDNALENLDDVPSPDGVVVCHGDACAPNTLIGDDGSWSGHVDLGSLGVGDRWADLAVATWSTGRNYGAGWETTLLGAYGVAPDPDRMAYYRLLWDLGP